jgi:hypothetical protein
MLVQQRDSNTHVLTSTWVSIAATFIGLPDSLKYLPLEFYDTWQHFSCHNCFSGVFRGSLKGGCADSYILPELRGFGALGIRGIISGSDRARE